MTKFSDLNLDPKVLQAVADAGYETPTPIQAEAIPHALQGRDVLGIAQTGTGKTAGFVLPLITILAKGRARARMPRSLILCPTRELAAQVAENFETYSKNHKLSMALLIGGVSFKDQDRLIDRGVDVLIATPGRLLDHFERGKLMLTGVQVMVVDEADRMLDMGFIPDIERIFKLTPFTRQTLFFSATMAPEITRITQEFLHNPVRVEVARQATTSETIEQVVVEHTPSRRDRAAKEKRDLLRALIEAEGDTLTNAIIFCNRKVDVDIVAKSLKKYGHDANPIHGDLDQSIRMKILSSFRDGELKFLVASDVAARGLDIPNVSHVFNFDVPIHAEDYVHRIGRTGRAGRKGKSITLSLPVNQKHLDAIEDLVKLKIPRQDNPLKQGRPAPVEAEEKPAPKPRQERPKRENPERPQRDKQERPQREKPEQQKAAPAPKPRQSGRNGGGGRTPQGLGHHVPAFMLQEFRLVSQTEPAVEPEDDLVEEIVETTPVVAEKPKRKPRKRVTKKTEAPVVEVVEAEVPEVKVEESSEKPKRRTRKRATQKAPETADNGGDSEAKPDVEPVAKVDEKAEKPKRKRATKKPPQPKAADKGEEPAVETETVAEKPKRTRVRKKPETTDKPAVKPKRKPRKKAEPKVEPVVETPKVEPAPAKPKARKRITQKAPVAETDEE